MTSLRIPVIPPSVDFPDWCAAEILKRHKDDLPDLGSVTVLLPTWTGANALRRSLARQAGRPLLGPDIVLPQEFATARAADGPALSPLECRLLLTVALQKRPALLPPGSDASRVAEALHALFEELAAGAQAVPDDETAFTQALQDAYGCGAKSWLSAEAQLVFQLWRAFLEDSGQRSPAVVYRNRLMQVMNELGEDERVYLLGFDEFSAAERAAVSAALHSGRAELWTQGRSEGRDGVALQRLLESLDAVGAPVTIASEDDTASTNPRQALLDQAFAEMPTRIDALKTPEIRIAEANSAEAEARVVDLAIREAVLDGCKDVVVLTQDRRLARRLRALLERAGLPLQDPVGWALSTSSAAALVDAWFECIEQRFHFRPLLEVLKSSFVESDPSGLEFLERELIFRKKLESGLDRLAEAARPNPELHETLGRVRAAARVFAKSQRSRPGHLWTADLLLALRELKADTRLLADPAGQKLINLLEQLKAAFKRQAVALDFAGFRDLLTRAMEAETFVPDHSPGPVRLLTLEQSQNLRCGYLIVAGASRDLFPGGVPAQPFFNQSVRADLRLPDWPGRLALGLSRFRRAIESAPKVLLTYSSASVHDAAQPSPWLEALESHARACGVDLREHRLVKLAATSDVEIAEDSQAPGQTQRPSPIVSPSRLPTEVSASGHQSLIDCPYKFHARYALGLHQPEAPDEDPARKDYGDKVHIILRAFTEQVDDLPPPFVGTVTEANRADAQQRLQEIADAVFGPELQRRALALSWQAEFRGVIPAFLDWVQKRGDLREVHTEIELREAVGDVGMKGTLDRLEVRSDGNKVVVDYKTGSVASKSAVRSGESVQLLHYAGLDPRIVAAEFLPLKAGERAVVLNDELVELRHAAQRRLLNTLEAARHGAGMPANGDELTCRRCDYRGLCRKGDWSDA